MNNGDRKKLRVLQDAEIDVAIEYLPLQRAMQFSAVKDNSGWYITMDLENARTLHAMLGEALKGTPQ